MRRQGWTRRDDDDLRRLYHKAGGEQALLERLRAALETTPRQGRRKGAVSPQSQFDDFLHTQCESNKRAHGIPYARTIEWLLGAEKRALKALAEHGVVGVRVHGVPYYGASANAIAKRLRRKRKDI